MVAKEPREVRSMSTPGKQITIVMVETSGGVLVETNAVSGGPRRLEYLAAIFCQRAEQWRQ